MRNLLLNLSQALNDLAVSVGRPTRTPEPTPPGKHPGGRPKGAIGKRWRDCLRAVCGPDGAGTFGVSDISRTCGKPITRSKMQRELEALVQAGHLATRTEGNFQITEQGLAMLYATELADDKH